MKKFISFVLAFVMVIAVALPVQAQTATSFDFDMEYQFNFHLQGPYAVGVMEEVNALFGGDGFVVGVSGTAVADGLAMSMYMEVRLDMERILTVLQFDDFMPMLTLLNVDLNEPFRFWFDMDFSDLDAPVYVMVMEVPPIVRLSMVFLGAGVEISRQYWVMDLSEFMAEIATELEAEILQLSDERRAEIVAYMEDAIETFLSGRVWAWFENYVTVHEFSFGYDEIYNGYSAYLNFIANITDGDEILDVGFVFSCEITNIGTAEKVPMPVLTDENSADFFAVLDALLRF
ncbi:MAG: hypothetical protein FWC89_10765 [Defluviitaleaceae bacterium]|nr:hypothetical protein [Defluviitaleaceae bacterium]